MFPPNIPISNMLPKNIKVWVLAPFITTDDANLDYYYDFSQSIAEYTQTFAALNIPWQWQPVTLSTIESVIQQIHQEQLKGDTIPIVLNICDGDEVNGTPGISVVQLLENNNLIYTGAEAFFYEITTSKIPMKLAFDDANIATPKWEAIHAAQQDISGIFDRLGSPIIIKPAVSGGSMGVGIKNVVKDEATLKIRIAEMFEGYRGWNLCSGGLIAEAFIAGAEYTGFISGTGNWATVYEPVERIFHQSLPEEEKFLSFDRLWEIYEEETPMPQAANFYDYAKVDPAISSSIQSLCLQAYHAVKGTGYTRVDIRKDAQTGKLYVLEVNAQCGISEDENYTSIGAILKASNKSFTQLVVEIMQDAWQRHATKNQSTSLTLNTI